MADWQKIKTEYITTDTSYRKLAAKYGVHHVQIARVGKDEHWVELKEQYATDTLAKTIDAVSSAQAQRAARLQTVADSLLTKIEEMVSTGTLTATTVRNITGALRDLKEIQMIKSDADLREQEARIDKLRREAQRDNDDNTAPMLIIEGLPEEFAV